MEVEIFAFSVKDWLGKNETSYRKVVCSISIKVLTELRIHVCFVCTTSSAKNAVAYYRSLSRRPCIITWLHVANQYV